jgi:hypothetical protein
MKSKIKLYFSKTVFIGYKTVGEYGNRFLCGNTVIGACAGRGLPCNSNSNTAIGVSTSVGIPAGYTGSEVVGGAIAVGAFACAARSNSIALGTSTRVYGCNSIAIGTNSCTRCQGDVIIGHCSSASYSASHVTVIGSCNSFFTSRLSGAIVLGSCNQNISTTFVLGSPVFPLSARPDTTLAGQVSSLFVTINGQNRRIAIFS